MHTKILKIIKIFIISLLCLYALFITEESIRLKINDNSKPLIVLDRTKYCISCLEPGEEIDFEYFSLGYKIKVKYYMSEDSSDDNKMVKVMGKEFYLFYGIRLWSWVS